MRGRREVVVSQLVAADGARRSSNLQQNHKTSTLMIGCVLKLTQQTKFIPTENKS